MSDAGSDPGRSDPFNDVITLLAAPLATGIQTYERMRKGVDELFRAIENLNTTMENLNDTTARVNRLLADVEEPIRAMIPRITRTINTADELMEAVGGPAMRAAPKLVQVVDTLTSPAFAALPHRLDEFVELLGDAGRRLGPLTQLAESAGSMFGLRMPGRPTTASSSTEAAAPTAQPAARQPATTEAATKKAATKRAATKKAATKRAAAKRAPTKKAATKSSGATSSGA